VFAVMLVSIIFQVDFIPSVVCWGEKLNMNQQQIPF